MPTIEEALAYLGYDYPDELIRKNVARDLAAAIKTFHGAVGEDVETLMPDDPRASELVLIYTDDLHSNKGTTSKASTKVSDATRRMVADMELQLRLELRTLREEAAGV